MWHFFSSSTDLVEEEISLTMIYNLKILGIGAFLFPQLGWILKSRLVYLIHQNWNTLFISTDAFTGHSLGI